MFANVNDVSIEDVFNENKQRGIHGTCVRRSTSLGTLLNGDYIGFLHKSPRKLMLVERSIQYTALLMHRAATHARRYLPPWRLNDEPKEIWIQLECKLKIYCDVQVLTAGV
jgi:hypothetical protein